MKRHCVFIQFRRFLCLMTLLEVAACAPLATPPAVSSTPADNSTRLFPATGNVPPDMQAAATGTAVGVTAQAAPPTLPARSTSEVFTASTTLPMVVPPGPGTLPSPPSSPLPPSTVTPAAVAPAYVLYAEQLIGAYTIRLWHPAPNTGMYDSATISQAGQAEIRIESVQAVGNLPAADITGDGYPDVMFETYAGGSHCCWGTVVYSLGPVPTLVLEIWSSPYYLQRTGRGIFQDLDGNGTHEFIAYDPLTGVECSQPDVKIILEYEPGRGYVGASPRFAASYADDIIAHTRQAEAAIEQSKNGYKCDVYPVVVDYLYSGQTDRAWAELDRLYLAPDAEEFRAQLAQTVSQGRFFVGAVHQPTLTPTLPCATHTASLVLYAPVTEVRIGDTVRVTVFLNNDGCVTLGQPQYYLSIQSAAPGSVFAPSRPESEVHYLGVAPGGSDASTFELQAIATGQASVTASASFEVHLGYPAPAYWGSASTRESLTLTVLP